MALTPAPTTLARLIERGVRVHAPDSTIVTDDVQPERFEAGVEVFPGTTITGARSSFGAGTVLGKAGGGYFSNVVTGRGVDLFGGYFDDAVFADGVTIRGHAEMRGGTLLEEGAEAAHHVGYKMTICMPFVVAGSLINFCDALVAGGTSRKDHSEIGSCLALYNFTPWGDKFASLFGDVPRGVFLRQPRIFVGGQTQIVSPVNVGFGATIVAGASLRRDVPDGRMVGDPTMSVDAVLDTTRYGRLTPKFGATAYYVFNLHALRAWYDHVRAPFAEGDEQALRVIEASKRQIDKGIAERIKRLGKIIGKLPASLEGHRLRLQTQSEETARAKTGSRIDEHEDLLAAWPEVEKLLRAPAIPESTVDVLDRIATAMREHRGQKQVSGADGTSTYISALKSLPDELVSEGVNALRAITEADEAPS